MLLLHSYYVPVFDDRETKTSGSVKLGRGDRYAKIMIGELYTHLYAIHAYILHMHIYCSSVFAICCIYAIYVQTPYVFKGILQNFPMISSPSEDVGEFLTWYQRSLTMRLLPSPYAIGPLEFSSI